MSQRVYIFDTTLRDGEQVPGCQLNTTEKIEVAKTLERLGVDVIEAGFPVSSPGDFNSVVEISKAVSLPTICALTRAVQNDIEVAAEALKFAKHGRIHTGIGVSHSHIYDKLKSTPEQIIERAVAAVKFARNRVAEVEFYAEDAGRAEPEFLAKVVEAVIAAGATVINIPDTTGYCMPFQYGEKIKFLMDNVSNIDKAILSTHCHNDLGMATANSLAGVFNGARQVEVTINGIGERAGNTSLEEVVMALRCHKAFGYDTNINSKMITEASRLVSNLMNMPVQANKAIVGRNAFSHSSGIHQDGVLKSRESYEIIDPVDVGIDTSSIVLTARSGRAALKHHLERLGFNFEQEKIDKLYIEFLKMADSNKNIDDEDLIHLVGGEQAVKDRKIELKYVQILSGTLVPTATVIINYGGEEITLTDKGNGPVDAAINAIKQVLTKTFVLQEILIQSMSKGSNDVGRVHVQIMSEGKTVHGFSANTDIVQASVEAFVDGVNKLI